MLTIKNTGGVKGLGAKNVILPRAAFRALFFALPLLCLILTGCRPPGPRALLDGQRLIEHGRYAEAIERLKTATSLMSSNAQAWNYLGLAYHEAGQPNDAADAYRKALALDQNLVEVHYNLGCLWLEQNHPDLAKGELTAYTLHREKSPEGWIKLGEAQMGLRDWSGAERSLNQARLLEAQNPDALNDLGVVQMQRNHAMEAAQFFNAALRAKPDYAPAILNLAIASQQLGNRQYALERYRDYLSLKPRPTNSEAVEAVVRALEQGPTPTAAVPRPTVTPAATTNATRPANNTIARTPRPEPATPSNPRPVAAGNAPTEVTQVAPEPVIRGASEPASPTTAEPVVSSNSTSRSERRGFFSHVNPANLFRGSKTQPESSTGTYSPSATQAAIAPEPRPVSYPRYSYRSSRKPAEGDRPAAQKAFVEGAQAQQARQLPEAITAYRRAIQLDPAYFDAYYNLGVVSVQAGNLSQALSAYETALAIDPGSHDARFNFALALKQANYPIDAANELEKVLAKSPNDIYAHYALGGLYALQLRQPAKAREHYQKVLELNPAFPQASAIHDWLWANPR